jgi:aryl-alcohol dehydrogenase-like predicted oxidoreductase
MPEAAILPTLRDLGVGLTAYGVLSRGLVSNGALTGESLKSRSHFPRFHGENLARNLPLVERLAALASARGATVAQLAIAWALSRGEDIVPLVGARRLDRLTEALGALSLSLSAEDLADIEAAMPAGALAGERYAPEQMRMLDSER